MEVSFSLNGKSIQIDVDPLKSLVDILREELGMLGTRKGCGLGECGSCLVVYNGDLANSCLIPAFRLEGSDILTVEGLSEKKDFPDAERIITDILEGRSDFFCTNSLIVAVKSLFAEQRFPDESMIEDTLKGIDCEGIGKNEIIERVKRLSLVRTRRRKV